MKGFLILSGLLSVAVARPSVQLLSSPLQQRSSALSLPQQLALLRLLPNAPLDPNGQVLEQLEVNQENEDRENAATQRVQASLSRDNSGLSSNNRNLLALSQLLSATSSASSHRLNDPRLLESLEASLNRGSLQTSVQREEQLGLPVQSDEANQLQQQSQQQQQQQRQRQQLQRQQQQQQQEIQLQLPLTGNSALLTATRVAHTLASLSPTGASSSSSIQIIESPELVAARHALQQQQLQQQQPLQQNLQQNLQQSLQQQSLQQQNLQQQQSQQRQTVLLTRDSNGLPVVVGSDGQPLSGQLLLL